MIHHYYHVYADGAWRKPVREHLEALADLDDQQQIRKVAGVVGSLESRNEVADRLGAEWEIVSGRSGYEQFTLDELFNDLWWRRKTSKAYVAVDDFVLYAHTKGAAFPTSVSTVWRHCMTSHLISDWERCVYALHDGADTVGVHWMTPEEYPDSVQIPYYGGNFWWARASHLLKLPPPSHETRYHAEAWLGTVVPDRAVDLQPGWPGDACRLH